MDRKATLELADSNVEMLDYHQGMLAVTIEMIDQLLGIDGVYYPVKDCIDTIARRCKERDIDFYDGYHTFVDLRRIFNKEYGQIGRELVAAQELAGYAALLAEGNIDPKDVDDQAMVELNALQPNRSTKLYAA